MEMMKANVKTIATTTEAIPQITTKTTLGELLSILGLKAGDQKPSKTPTPKKLRTTAVPVAKMFDCVVYNNGFAYYNNGSNHSVVWLPYCVSFTYHFNPLRDAEKNYLYDKKDLPDDLLEATSWVTAVTLIAEHRIEHHIDTNSGIGHSDVADNAESEEQGENDIEDKDKCCVEFMWLDEPIGVNPLDALIRKETRETMLAELTDKQREVFVLFHKYEYTQAEIAKKLGLSRSTVKEQIRAAEKKAKNIFV